MDTTRDPLAAVEAARRAVEAAEADLRSVVRSARTAGIPIVHIAKAADRSRQTIYTWTEEITVRNETITADCPPATLADIVMQTWPARGVPSVGDGRWATVTIPASDTQELGRELDARGIEWGLA